MTLKSLLSAALFGLLTLIGVYYLEKYLIGGFHSGWYMNFSYLLTIPIAVGVALLFVKDLELLKLLTFMGTIMLVIVAVVYTLGSLGHPWAEIMFTLYHLPMAWFAALAFCWARDRTTV